MMKLSWTQQKATQQVILGLTAMLVGSTPATAAQPEVPIALRFKYDLQEPPSKLQDRLNIIRLRANVPQPVYLFAVNESEDIVRQLQVELFQVTPTGATALVRKTTIAKLVGKEMKQIVFAAAKPAGPPKPPAPPKKGEIPGISLAGPPFELQVRFTYKTATKTVMLPVRIMEPSEYLAVVKKTYDTISDTLTIQLRGGKRFHGPHCDVRLDLQPTVIPRYMPTKKTGGIYQRAIRAGQDSTAELRAEKLQFDGDPPAFGRVYVTVDGYQRAFQFNNSFTKGTLRELSRTKPRLRFFVPRYLVSGPKTKVRVEVDNPPNVVPRSDVSQPRPKPILVRLVLDPDGNGQSPIPVKDFVGDRNRQIVFETGGPKGALLFRSAVSDWETEMDTTGQIGVKYLRGQLLQFDPRRKQYLPVKLTKEQTDEEEAIQLLQPTRKTSPYAGLAYDQDGWVLAAMVMDSTPPAIDFGYELEKKSKYTRGAPLIVKAKVKDPSPVTPIKDVVFFVGKPDAKDTIPKGAPQVVGEQEGPRPQVWMAQLPIPTEKAGTFVFSVRATNRAGLGSTKTIKLILVDPPPKKDKGTTILGTVVVGDLPSPGVTVTLTNAKGAAMGVTKSKSKPPGQFAFTGVKPGVYQITAANPALQLQGKTMVQVNEGMKVLKDVTVKLQR